MNQPGWENEEEACTRSQYYLPLLADSKHRLSDRLGQHLSLEERDDSDKEIQQTFFKQSRIELIDCDEDEINVDNVYEEEASTDEMGKDLEQQDEEMSSDLDGEEDRSAGGRYFGGTGGPKCFNCNQPGHMALPCYLCGGKDHQRNTCPEEICYNCNRVGHISRNCSLPRKRRMFENDLCNRCNLPGHLQKDCSLNWRRYFFTREPVKQEIARAANLLSPACYNCADDTHFGDECHGRKRPEFSIFHYPILEFLQEAAYKRTDGKSHKRTTVSQPRRYEEKLSREEREYRQSNDPSYSRHSYTRRDEHDHRQSHDHRQNHEHRPNYGHRQSNDHRQSNEHRQGNEHRQSTGHRQSNEHRQNRETDHPQHSNNRRNPDSKGSYRRPEPSTNTQESRSTGDSQGKSRGSKGKSHESYKRNS